MSHIVICPYCKIKFDRDKEEYSLVGARRYAHAACMLRQVELDPNYEKKEIIDPLDNVVCAYCKKYLYLTNHQKTIVKHKKKFVR